MSIKATLRQCMSCITILCVSFINGCKVGWVQALVNNFVLNRSTSIQITQNDISWMTSISFTSTIFAVPLCYFLGRKVSYRWVVIGIITFYLIAWTIILCTPSLLVIMVFFWFCGITMATTFFISCVYISEVASPENREILCMFHILALSAGTELEYLLSMFHNNNLLPVLPIMVSICALLSFKLMLESPYHLASQGNNEQALANLNYLNDIQDEKDSLASLESVKNYINEQKETELTKNNLQIIFLPANLRLIIIMIIVCGLSELNVNLLAHNIGSFLVKDFTNYVNGDVFVNVNNITDLILPVFSIFILKKFNRKTLFKVGYPAAGFCQLILAACYYVESQNANTIGWLAYALTSLIVAFGILIRITFKFALELLKMEVFPHKLKEFYISLLICTENGFRFLTIKSYFYLEHTFGNAFIMVCYGISMFIIFAIIYFCIEETKGKTLLRIRMDMNKELERLI